MTPPSPVEPICTLMSASHPPAPMTERSVCARKLRQSAHSCAACQRTQGGGAGGTQRRRDGMPSVVEGRKPLTQMTAASQRLTRLVFDQRMCASAHPTHRVSGAVPLESTGVHGCTRAHSFGFKVGCGARLDCPSVRFAGGWVRGVKDRVGEYLREPEDYFLGQRIDPLLPWNREDLQRGRLCAHGIVHGQPLKRLAPAYELACRGMRARIGTACRHRHSVPVSTRTSTHAEDLCKCMQPS